MRVKGTIIPEGEILKTQILSLQYEIIYSKIAIST